MTMEIVVIIIVLVLIALFMGWLWSIRRLTAKLKHANQQLKIKSEALSRLSRTDSLTKLHNHLYLDEQLLEECQRYVRYQSPFCIIMLDVDKFKDVNDLYGHATGDSVLQGIAHELKSSVRFNDKVGRWGGEKFLLICPQTRIDGALALAELLRVKLDAQSFDPVPKLTCSFGVAEFKSDETKEQIVARADEALYRAKVQGTNHVCSSIDE